MRILIFSLIFIFPDFLFCLTNPDFESSLSGWTVVSGNAFDGQPVKGDVIPTFRIRPVMEDSLGGDYWRQLPHPVGHHGKFWVSSSGNHTSDTNSYEGDLLTGTLASDTFRLNAGRIYFLIGGTGGRIELWINENGSYVMKDLASPDGIEILSRKFFETVNYSGESAFINIVDDKENAHINVDDFIIEPDVSASDDSTVSYRFRTVFTDNEKDYYDLKYLKKRDINFPIWGFIDTHGHWMNQQGFGVDFIYGKPYGRIDTALKNCDVSHNTVLDFFSNVRKCSVNVFGKKSIYFAALHESKLSGYPDFEGWPNFRDLLHQSMFIDWVYRAYLGGMRLIVCPMGNNSNLPRVMGSNYDLSDTASVRREVDYLDRMISEIKNDGWIDIANSSEEAKKLLLENKLVIIKGMEVDQPGGFLYLEPEADKAEENREKIKKFIDYIYDNLGIRHMFPVHHCDNAFGGFSIYGTEFFSINNFHLRKSLKKITEKEKYVTVDSSSLVCFRLGGEKLSSKAGMLGNIPLAGLFDEYYRPPGSNEYLFNGRSDYTFFEKGKGHINKKGLTKWGKELLTLMMKRGMIFDIDHMSMRSANDALDLIESLVQIQDTSKLYYPLLAGHTNFLGQQLDTNETSYKSVSCDNCLLKLKNDHAKTDEMLEKIQMIGGMMSPITEGDKDVKTEYFKNNESPGSSKTWAEAYLYALEKLNYKNVGLGTDMNGLVTQISPRFATFSSYSLRNDKIRMNTLGTRRYLAYKQKNGVRYNTNLQDCKKEKFEGEGVFTKIQNKIWQAIYAAHSESTVELDEFQKKMKAGFVIGQRSATGSSLKNAIKFDEIKFAAYLVAMKYEKDSVIDKKHYPVGLGKKEIGKWYSEIDSIYGSYKKTLGDNIPLKRCEIKTSNGIKDFDFNIDGLAHYGLFPDFLQDLRNIGLNPEQMSVLFNSAKDFTELLHRCEIFAKEMNKQ